jgi:hypothetical protein
MTKFAIIIILFALLINCSPRNHSTANKKFIDGNQIILTDTSDEKLKLTWTLFAKAILANDTISIKKLSTNCINCSVCVTNTPLEDSLFENFKKNNPENWYEELYEELCYIPIDNFIKNDLLIIFNNKIKPRMLDSSKIAFFDDYHNRNLYQKICISATAKIDKTKHKEVLLTSVDPNNHFEGAQHAYAFILTNEGYKFCGFSTIP